MKTPKFLCAIILFSSIQTIAQTSHPFDKGNMIVDGSAFFKSQGGEMRGDNRNTILSLSSSYLFFVVPHFSVGFNLGYQHTKMFNSKQQDD